MIIRAPPLARASAVARPIPRDAPVTSATLLELLVIMISWSARVLQVCGTSALVARLSSGPNKKPLGSLPMHHIDTHVKEHFVLIGSLCDNRKMGRPKKFN